MKINKKQKTGIAVLLGLMITLCFVAYTLKPSEVTLATEVKLRTFETLNQNEPMADENLLDADKIKEWAMPIVEGTLKSQKLTLTDDEYEKVFQSIVKTLKSTVDAGNIQKDENGNLTDLSKSYIANAVANAISYAVPKIDLESAVDTGTTQYEQILDMQKMLNSLETSNKQLKESVNTINTTYQNSVSNTEKQISVVSDTYCEKLDALYTELLAKITANKQTGERLTKDLSDLQDIVNDLLNTQKETLSTLSTAVTNIQTLTEDVTKLQSTDTETSAALKEINNNIKQINLSITQTQDSLTTLINENVTKLSSDINSTKSQLTTDLATTKSGLTDDLNNQTKAISDRLDEISKNLKDTATSDKEEFSKKIDELDKKNAKDLADAKTSIKAEIDELRTSNQQSISELNERVTTIYTELNKKIGDNYDALSASIIDLDTKMTEALENAKNEIGQTITSIQNQLQANIDAANARIDSANQTIAALTERVVAAENSITSINTQITQMSTKYDKAIQELWAQVNENTADIAALSARLDAFIASSDGHYKVDMIPGFTISDWATEGSNATYTVSNDFLIGCVAADVDYDAQYEITPTYIVDNQAGTLKILIPLEEKQPVTVSDIICYHVQSDDKVEDTTSHIEKDEPNDSDKLVEEDQNKDSDDSLKSEDNSETKSDVLDKDASSAEEPGHETSSETENNTENNNITDNVAGSEQEENTNE